MRDMDGPQISAFVLLLVGHLGIVGWITHVAVEAGGGRVAPVILWLAATSGYGFWHLADELFKFGRGE